MKIIEVDGLAVRYQSALVLTDVSFAIDSGDYIAIVGPNGSGKTTLVRTILGLTPPAAGTVRLYGSPSPLFREWCRVGYLPQVSERLHRRFPGTVREIVGSGLLSRKRFPKRLSRSDARQVDQTLDLLGIGDLGNRMIGRLSGGQQQRVLLARALAADPELLILDEPTVALDPQTRVRFYETLRELNRQQGKTVVLITHDSGTVGEFADKLLYLDRRLVFFGSFAAFCESPKMAEYFGEFAQHVICHRH
jgi:zinc transport system ATP-binding protein